MCVLHVVSFAQSFSEYLKDCNLPIYHSHEKGDLAFITKQIYHINYGFSCNVSKREWTDTTGQIDDAYKFLLQYEKELRHLIDTMERTEMWFDFPIESRHSDRVIVQCDYLPAKFLSLAGNLGIGIELSYYPNANDNEDTKDES